jgi:hypothetical protein
LAPKEKIHREIWRNSAPPTSWRIIFREFIAFDQCLVTTSYQIVETRLLLKVVQEPVERATASPCLEE